MNNYQLKYKKYKSRYQHLRAYSGGADITPDLEVYAVIEKGVSNIPDEWEDITDNIPDKLWVLKFVIEMNPTRRAYSLPILESVSNLVDKWGTLKQDLFDHAKFDNDLTDIETEYLDNVKIENPKVQWDTNWSSGIADGVGIVGAPENTIIIGFTNNY